jgi:hypothetical protein
MPTTAMVVTPNFGYIFQNPTFIYAGTALPGAGARLGVAITADGIPTPDATTNPTAFWLGTSKEGTKFSVANESDQLIVDEYDGPVDERIIRTSSSLEGEMYEALDLQRLQKILPGTQYSSLAAITGVQGAQQISGGGLVTLPKMPVIALAIDPLNPTCVIAAMLYAAVNRAGLALPMSGKTRATVPYKFEGYDVIGRAKGDRHWTFWKQTPALP